MNGLLKLTEYRLRAIRKPLFWILALMGPAELAVMAVNIFARSLPHVPIRICFGSAVWVVLFCMGAAALANFVASTQDFGRSRFIHTLMLLPIKRSAVFLSGVISGLIAVWAVIAAQAIWFMLLYVPVGCLSAINAQAPIRTAFMINGLFLNMVRTPAMQLLMPHSLHDVFYLVVMVLAPVVCLQAAACHAKKARTLYFLLAGISAFISLRVLWMQYETMRWNWAAHPVRVSMLVMVQLAVIAFVGLRTIQNLNNAKNL